MQEILTKVDSLITNSTLNIYLLFKHWGKHSKEKREIYTPWRQSFLGVYRNHSFHPPICLV